MFNHAFFLTQAFPHVLRPPPTGLISGPSDRHAADAYEFKLAFLKSANLIGFFETLQNNLLHRVFHSTETSSRLFFSQALIARLVTFPFASDVWEVLRILSFIHLNCSREWLLAVSPSELSRRSAKQLGSERVKINRGQADGNIRKRFGCRVPTIVPSTNFLPVGFQKGKCYSLCGTCWYPKEGRL
jgi:hypothetical protein